MCACFPALVSFSIQVRVVHDGDPIFPKEVAKATEAFMEAQADEDGITYDELRAVDRRSPIMLWPGARFRMSH